MKAKDWVKVLKPLIEEVLKYMEDTSEQASTVYNAYAERCDQLHRECNEIIDMRMKNFDVSKAMSFFQRDELRTRKTNAIREASVKLKSITTALRNEMGLDTLPFPLMDSMMFMPTITHLQTLVFDNKHELKVLQDLYKTTVIMMNDLCLQDDKLVKAIMDSVSSRIAQIHNKELLTNMCIFANIVKDAQAVSSSSDGKVSILTVLASNPKAMELSRKIRSGITF